ncbi:hypothetical protein MKW98_016148, partial [Papaver atlanticum]
QYFWSASIAGLLAFLSLFYYLSVLITRIRNTRINNKKLTDPKLSSIPPPEVAGAWPIVGHLPQLVKPKPLCKILGDMSDKYGSIFMVRFGMYPTLVVSSWELSKECFTTNDRCLANRPPSASGKYLTSALFCFSSYGPYWREIRKICTLKLLSRSRLELLKHVPYSEIDNCIRRLHRHWMKTPNQMEQSRAAAASIKVDMSQLFRELTLNAVLKIVVGKSLLPKDDDDENYPNDYHNKDTAEGQKLHETITEFTKLAR